MNKTLQRLLRSLETLTRHCFPPPSILPLAIQLKHPLLQVLVDQSLQLNIVLASHLASEQNIFTTVFYAPATLSHYFHRILSILASFHASSFVNIPLAFFGEKGEIPKTFLNK